MRQGINIIITKLYNIIIRYSEQKSVIDTIGSESNNLNAVCIKLSTTIIFSEFLYQWTYTDNMHL